MRTVLVLLCTIGLVTGLLRPHPAARWKRLSATNNNDNNNNNDRGVGLPSAPERFTASLDARVKGVTKSVERVVSAPVTFFRGAAAVTQKVTDVLSGKPSPPPLPKEDLKPTKVPQPTALDIFEDVKEGVYMTIDGVTALSQTVVATVETIAALPTTIADASAKAASTAASIQADLVQAQKSATQAVEAGKKQVETIQAIAKDPSVVVKGLVPSATPPPPPPPPPVPAPRVPAAPAKKPVFDPAAATTAATTAVETLKTLATVATAVKGGLEVTVGAVGAAAAGAASLKQRIDNNLVAQGLADPVVTPKRQANAGKGPAPVPVPGAPQTDAAPGPAAAAVMDAVAPEVATAFSAPTPAPAPAPEAAVVESRPVVVSDDVKSAVDSSSSGNIQAAPKRFYGLGGGKRTKGG